MPWLVFFCLGVKEQFIKQKDEAEKTIYMYLYSKCDFNDAADKLS